jgi:cytochrome c6
MLSLPIARVFAQAVKPAGSPKPAATPLPRRHPFQTAGVKLAGLALAVAAATVHPPTAWADEVPSAAQAFANTCAGCHAGGGNVVRRDATLRLEDLQKYGIDSVDELYKVIYSGRGTMPGYGEGCAPKGACTFAKRLSDGEVQGLSQYVLDQAKGGWAG